MRTLLSFFIILVQSASSFQSEPPGTWKNFTAMENVKAGARTGSILWAAGPGGVFTFEEGTAELRIYTVAEGLSTNDVTAIRSIDGDVWIGAANGSVDIVRPDGSIGHIRDINESQRVQKRVRRFSASGDSVFIGTDFGVSVYRKSRTEFGDTYSNFGFTVQGGVNGIVVLNDEIWVATDQGVARADRFATNLSAPTSWQRYQTPQGLPSNTVTGLIVVGNTIVAGTSSGAAYFDGAAFQFVASLGNVQIVDMLASGTRWFVIWNSGATFTMQEVQDAAGPVQTIASNTSGTANGLVEPSGTGIPTAATSFRGIGTWDGSSWNYTIPNGPKASLFSSLAVNVDGVLWCASGVSGQGRGFYRYDLSKPDGERWKNFTLSDHPVMETNDYYKVSLGAEGRVWISSWGNGVVEIAADTIRRRLDAGSSPAFASSVSPSIFEVIGSAAVDQSGQTWFVNRTAVNGNYLAYLVSDATFAYRTNQIHPGQGVFTNMVIDGNGTKWLANAEPFNKPATGLYYYNGTGIVSGTSSTGGWGYMNTADGLPHNTVLSFAVDLTGSVCVGTDIGFMMISEPLFPKQRRFSSFPLREQSVQVIAVDAVNNKWVGTKEGVFVMNPDATQILQQYTVANTGGRLADNDIRSIAIDQQRGIAYIGTERGLSSLTIAPVQTERSLSTLDIGPNPYILPAAGMLTIRKLVEESSIKILRVDGSLVTEFRAQGGGRAFWDGKDKNGSLVGSGVYFVVVFAESGDEVAVGKVAVVRK